MLAKVEAVGDGGEVRFGSKAEGGGQWLVCPVSPYKQTNPLYAPASMCGREIRQG
jgi:hypothetical protein